MDIQYFCSKNSFVDWPDGRYAWVHLETLMRPTFGGNHTLCACYTPAPPMASPLIIP